MTYVAHVQPILRTTCNRCHSAGASAPFADSYAATQRTATRVCFGDVVVGACINRVVQDLTRTETACRLDGARPHDGAEVRCPTDEERSLIMAWVAGGMIER